MVDIAITNRNRNVHNLAINDTAIGLFILMQRDYVILLIQIKPVLMVSPTGLLLANGARFLSMTKQDLKQWEKRWHVYHIFWLAKTLLSYT